jgi:hypothetical protein
LTKDRLEDLGWLENLRRLPNRQDWPKQSSILFLTETICNHSLAALGWGPADGGAAPAARHPREFCKGVPTRILLPLSALQKLWHCNRAHPKGYHGAHGFAQIGTSVPALAAC